ncbi:MAG: hypothetical protein ACRDDY_19605 [Clostridium sp.]|uniref:hypothetical protein n=1 Tax=Clostridium sp. TaxID=1506 RepID=UPI003EE6A8E2
MAKLYGMSNQIISEMIMRLMTDEVFYKFVYYKDTHDEDILSMPDLDDPVSELYNKQVWLHRRPKKILHEQDVNVFLTLEDMRNETAKNKDIKTMAFKIGILVHENCLTTANGSRDIAILERVQYLIENDAYFSGLGECRVNRVNHLFGLGIEYSGFDVIFKIDGIREKRV